MLKGGKIGLLELERPQEPLASAEEWEDQREDSLRCVKTRGPTMASGTLLGSLASNPGKWSYTPASVASLNVYAY